MTDPLPSSDKPSDAELVLYDARKLRAQIEAAVKKFTGGYDSQLAVLAEIRAAVDAAPTVPDEDLAAELRRMGDCIAFYGIIGFEQFTAAFHRAAQLIERLAASRLSVPREGELRRMFPIQYGPAIPWDVIAPYDYQAKRNHSQTLERLAERGGLDPTEAIDVLLGQPYAHTAESGVRGAAAVERLLQVVRDIEALRAAPLPRWSRRSARTSI